MIEALRTLANITDYSDDELASLVDHFGRECALYQLTVPVTAVIAARREMSRVKDPGDAAVSSATIVAAAEAMVDAGRACEPKDYKAEYLTLCRLIDNMRGYTAAGPCKK